MKTVTRELKYQVRKMESVSSVRMLRQNFEDALRLAIRQQHADDRAAGLPGDSIRCEGFKAILRASQSGRYVWIAED